MEGATEMQLSLGRDLNRWLFQPIPLRSVQSAGGKKKDKTQAEGERGDAGERRWGREGEGRTALILLATLQQARARPSRATLTDGAKSPPAKPPGPRVNSLYSSLFILHCLQHH